ncbi:MAG: response regulator [Vulcanimicrobiota bacterium]
MENQDVNLEKIESVKMQISEFGDEEEKNILIIEDDPITLKLIKKYLEKQKYNVITRTDGNNIFDLTYNLHPDIIILDIMIPGINGLDICKQLKSTFITENIPIILVTGKSNIEDKVLGLSLGADDYLAKPFDLRELGARIKTIMRRSKQSLNANPLSGLPGNIAIQYEISRRIKNQIPYAVCYLDLDNFKSYNDRYGFELGDKVIKAVSRILIEAYLHHRTSDDFVGHVGGDDFIYIARPDRADGICEDIIEKFDGMVPGFYNEKDQEKGFFRCLDRQGIMREYPLMSVSIAVVSSEQRKNSHHGEVAQIAAELKKYAKKFKGSIYVKDRRKESGIIQLE